MVLPQSVECYNLNIRFNSESSSKQKDVQLGAIIHKLSIRRNERNFELLRPKSLVHCFVVDQRVSASREQNPE